MLILLSSFPSSFESLVAILLVGKSTIKMKEVTYVLLQNEVLQQKNRVLSLGGNLALMVIEDDDRKRWSGKRS